MADISCGPSYAANVLLEDPSSSSRGFGHDQAIDPSSCHGVGGPVGASLALSSSAAARAPPPRGLSSTAPRGEGKLRDVEGPMMFRKNAASCYSQNAAILGLKKHDGPSKHSQYVATPPELHRQPSYRQGGRQRPQRGQHHRAVLNDHLLWLELRRELRSKQVVTNVAANVVARRYIHELAKGLGAAEERPGGRNSMKPTSSAGIDLVDNARFFGIMPLAPASRSQSAGSSSIPSRNRINARRASNKVDATLRTSIAKLFDPSGGSSSTTPASSLPGSRHPSGGALSEMNAMMMSMGEGYHDGSSPMMYSQNLKNSETLQASHFEATRAAARKNSGVGWMMKNLGDSLSRESQQQQGGGGNGDLSSSSSMSYLEASVMAEDLLVRASLSSSRPSGGTASPRPRRSSAGALTIFDGIHELDEGPSSSHQPEKKKRGSLGSLSAGLMALHETLFADEQQPAKYNKTTEATTEASNPPSYHEMCSMAATTTKKPSLVDKKLSCEEEEYEYNSVVRAFATLREESGGELKSMGKGQKQNAGRRGSLCNYGFEEDEDGTGEELLVGFGEKPKPPRPIMAKQSSVIAKTA